MKRIATIHNNAGHVIGIVHGPDVDNQSIVVNGRVWRFDFDRYGGPLWLKADGHTPRKNQCPTSNAVWKEFTHWHKQFRKEKANRERRLKMRLATNRPLRARRERA